MKLRKLFYSVRYIRFSQLWARLRLMTKRKVISSFPNFFNKQFLEKEVDPVLAVDIAAPIFTVRKDKFSAVDKISKKFSLTFLNECRSYQLPINWHEEELEYGTRLWKLNLHYMEFLEEVDDDWFRWIVKDWIEKNPPYKEGYWLDSWNSFALSIRVVVWMQQLAKRRDQLPVEFVNQVSESIYRQLLFLEKNLERDIMGNHLIKNIKALLWGASFFKKDKNIKRLSLLGKNLLSNELEDQILDDGLHYERSPAYHCQVLADLLECHWVLDKSTIKEKLETALLKMGNALVAVTHPDKIISLFNDGGLEMAYSPNELINVLKELIEFTPKERKEIALREAGYFGLQKNDSYLLFDAGKVAPDFLPAHGHGDIFSFEWTIGDERIFIDKGVFEYNNSEKRELSRSTKSHNTVNIDGKDQCEFWSSFRIARRANVKLLDQKFVNGILEISAMHDGYQRLAGSPVHQRKLQFNGHKLFIKDKIDGQKHLRAEARFLVGPSIRIKRVDDGVVLIGKSCQLRFTCHNPIDIIDTMWFPNFGMEQPCQQLIIDLFNVPCEAEYIIEVIEK